MPIFRIAFALLALFATTLKAGVAAATLDSLRTLELDANECYRVRDLSLRRGDVRFYLTDGYLTFSKPVRGAPVAAVFSAAVDGGDAEIIAIPPDRDERRNLAARTHSPNLDEHLGDAIFLFSDDTAAELLRQIGGNEWMHRDPARGAEMASRYATALKAVIPQFSTPLLLDLMDGQRTGAGLFAAMLGGKTLGTFEVVFNPRVPEPLLAGHFQPVNGKPQFDIWSSYRPKSMAPFSPSAEFHVDNYRIEARIDRDLHMTVTSEFQVVNLPRDLHALEFDLSEQMRVVNAEVDGQPAEFEFQRSEAGGEDPGDGELAIVPESVLKAGISHTVRITHSGDVITAGPGGTYFVGSRGRWYPHRILEFSKFDLIFHLPGDFDLVASGEPVRDVLEGDERTIERRSSASLPMVGFNFGHYRRTTVKRDGLTVEICADRNAASDLEQRASDVAGVMKFYTERFGPPPLNYLVVSPLPATFGQGFGGLIYLSTYAYAAPEDPAFAQATPEIRVFFTQLMQAHEAAHQWWGNLVTTAGYHDEWIIEALANYSAMQYLKTTVGEPAVRNLMRAYRNTLLARNAAGDMVDSAGSLTEGRRLESNGRRGAWISILYGKGTWVMQMLAAHMGEDRFFAMLAELRRRYAGQGITTDHFRSLCAEFLPPGAADPKLEDFFDQWVWSTGIPKLKLAASVKNAAHGAVVSGALAQTEVPEDFSAEFPIEMQSGSKRITRWVMSASDPVEFRWTLPGAVKEVALDPEQNFLCQ